MIKYNVALFIAALIGGACSVAAVNYFFFEEDNTAQRHATYCEHFKYNLNPFPGCEASHVGVRR